MEEYEIDEVLEEEGINKERLETALELARLIAEETEPSSEAFGQLIWAVYRKLEREEE